MDRDYTYRIIGCIYEVYNQLGPGLLESIYEAAMIQELRNNGFEVRNQVVVPALYLFKTDELRIRLCCQFQY